MIKTKDVKFDILYETDNSFGEYKIETRRHYYIFGIRIWRRVIKVEHFGVHEWIARYIG